MNHVVALALLHTGNEKAKGTSFALCGVEASAAVSVANKNAGFLQSSLSDSFEEV